MRLTRPRSGQAALDAQERIDELAALLEHDDPAQLLFQLAEIAGEQSYLRHRVEVGPGDVVIDVGANVGVAAGYFAAQRGVERVYSFEPVAPVFAMLERNVRGLPACRAYPQGMSSSAGWVPITYYPGSAAMSGLYADRERDRTLVRTALLNAGFSPEGAEKRLSGFDEVQSLSAEMTTLSHFVRHERVERVDLLKIDVERAELDVLAGLADEDWPRVRQLVVEVHDEDGRCAGVQGMLEARGFRVATQQEETMRGTSVMMLYATRA